jgi:hypothetical protein
MGLLQLGRLPLRVAVSGASRETCLRTKELGHMIMCRMAHLHRALKRAGLTGIGRTDDQGSFIDAVG